MERTAREKEDMYALLKCMIVILKVERLDHLFGNAINDLAAATDEVKTIDYAQQEKA
jgi:hypothetical protein